MNRPAVIRAGRTMIVLILLAATADARGKDGSAAWLRHDPLKTDPIRETYRAAAATIVAPPGTAVLQSAAAELQRGLTSMLGQDVPIVQAEPAAGAILLVPRLAGAGPNVRQALHDVDPDTLGVDGFALRLADLRHGHHQGVEQAEGLLATWEKFKGRIDGERFEHVRARLARQVEHDAQWRNTMTLFFFQLSGIGDGKKRVRSDYRLRHVEGPR